MKKNIIFMALGMIIMAGIGIGVYAINANEITYNNTTVDQALDTLYSSVNMDKIIGISHTYKETASWSYTGISNVLNVDSNYLTRTIEGDYSYFNVLKDCRIRIYGMLKNTEANSSAPKYKLYQNNTLILSIDGVKTANTRLDNTIVVDAHAGDKFHLGLYGGGNITYTLTIFEVVHEED